MSAFVLFRRSCVREVVIATTPLEKSVGGDIFSFNPAPPRWPDQGLVNRPRNLIDSAFRLLNAHKRCWPNTKLLKKVVGEQNVPKHDGCGGGQSGTNHIKGRY